MELSSAPPGRLRPSTVAVAVGLPLALVLIGLGGITWHISSQPASNAQDHVAQAQMLLGVFQGVLGLTIAVSTVYYAVRTGEMVEVMHESTVQAGLLDRRIAVDRAAESAIDVALESATMAELMKKDWRWSLPWKSNARARLLELTWPRIADRTASAVKALETLKALEPRLETVADQLGVLVEQMFSAAVAGSARDLAELAASAREASQALRTEMGRLG